MGDYLDYQTYKDFGGTLDETTFDEYEFEAECIVDWYTFDRLHDKEKWFPTSEESLQRLYRCMYALIKLAKQRADAMALGAQTTTTTTEGGVTTTVTTSASIESQSNDGVSISYNTPSAAEIYRSLSPYRRGGEVYMTIHMYLQGVMNSLGRKILYRGIYEDE